MSNDPGDPHLRRIAVDPDAFEAFYREHLDAIHRFVARGVANPHHASDLVADIFLAAIDGAATYDPHRGPPVAWLFGIARNVVADDLRQRARERRAFGRVGGRDRSRTTPSPRPRSGSTPPREPGRSMARSGACLPTSAPSSSSSPSTGSRSATPPEPSECSRSPRGSGFTVPAGPSPPPSARPPTRRPATDPTDRLLLRSRRWPRRPCCDDHSHPQRPLDSYETALLSELRGEVRRRALSPAAAPAPRPVRRRLVLAGASVAAVAAAVTVPLALGGSPAYAVSPNSDGSVTVTIQRAEDAAGLQQALADNGVAARVDYVPSGYACDPARFTPASGEASGPVSVQRAGDGRRLHGATRHGRHWSDPRHRHVGGREPRQSLGGQRPRGGRRLRRASRHGRPAAGRDNPHLGPGRRDPGTAEPGRLTRCWSRNAAGPDQRSGPAATTWVAPTGFEPALPP